MVVYHVVYFFPVLLLLDSSRLRCDCEDPFDYVVRLLHGFGLPPSGISGKMTITLDLTTIIAMLVASMLLLCHCYDAYLLLVSLPIAMLNL